MKTFNYTSASYNIVAWPAIGAAWLLRGAHGLSRHSTAKAEVRRPTLVSAALAVACLLMAGSALAATVTSLADSGAGSLRAAIAASFNGDTVDCRGLSGTITLTSGALTNARPITILGPGAKILTISGNHASRVFNILSTVTGTGTVISGLTISYGLVQGASGGYGVSGNDGGPGLAACRT